MTRKLIRLLLLLPLLSLLMEGQQNVGGGNGNGNGGGSGITITTVAGLATVPGKTAGTIAVVTNGSTGTDCTVGGGANIVICQYNGTTWAQIAAASSGATAFSAITGGTNAAALVMGTGGSLTVSGTGTITATGLTGTPSITINALTATTINGSALSGTFTGTPTFSGAVTFGVVPTFPSQSANTFFAAPSGGPGIPSFRAITVTDVPTLNQNTTGNAATATTSTNLAAGALGSIPYQSAANTTLFVASPVTSGHTFALVWQPSGSPIAPTSLDLATFLASPPAIGGTVAATGSFTNLSSSGTVSGTGFSNYLASPPSIGGTLAAAGFFTTLSATGNLTTNVTGGGIQCLQVNNGGVVSGTGSACGSGGGGLTSVGLSVNGGASSGIFAITSSPLVANGTLNINLSGTTGHFPYFTSSSILANNPNLDDGATATGTLTYVGIISSAPGGTGVGVLSLQGNTTFPTIPLNSVAFGAPNSTSFTSYGMNLPAVAPSGSQVLAFGTPSSGWSTGTWTNFLTPCTANGQIQIGSASSSACATITAGSGISVTNGANTITLAVTGGTAHALTMNGGGAGASPGSTFDGSAAVTASYNTFGAIGGSGGTADVIPMFLSANTIGNSSPQLDNGLSNVAALTYAGSGGIIASAGPIVSNGPSGKSGYLYLFGNTANQTVTSNTAGFMGPNVATFTAYALQLPSTGEGPGTVMQFGTLTSGVSTVTFTPTPTFGSSGTAGSISMFPTSGNFQTTLSSAATASNTVKFFSTVPANNDLFYCAVASTTCTLTDTGYPFNAIPNADLAHSSITLNPGGISVALGATGTIPLSCMNPQTATYQVTTADFANYCTISVASGTFTITLVASGSQPPAGQYIHVVNYGSGTVTVAVSGQLMNGGSGSITVGPATATAPQSVRISSNATNYIADGVAGTGSGGGGAVASITGDGSVITNSGSTGAVTLTLGSHWQLGTSGTSLIINGGFDTTLNGALGNLTLRGANQTGTGGASSQGGDVWVVGGSNAATNAVSAAGGAEISAGQSTSATTGLQGLLLSTTAYKKGATVTQWNLQCSQTTAKQTQDCPATPTNIIGVAEIVNTNSVVVAYDGEIPINASAAVTVGDTVCAAAGVGQVTDSGSTAPCSTGVTVGTVEATSGTYAYPDGTSFTATTTLPLVQLGSFQGNPINPQLNTNSSLAAGAGSGLFIPGTSLTSGTVYYQASGGLAPANACNFAAINITFTNGSAVIGTGTANTFNAGCAMTLTTTSALPTNFATGTTYYVIATGLSSAQFELSATPGGSAITAGSAGTGTQTANGVNQAPGLCLAISTTQCLYHGTYRYSASQSWTAGQLLYLSDYGVGYVAADYAATVLTSNYTGIATFTNASAVIGITNTLAAGNQVMFTSTGGLPTNFSPSVVYYVITTGLSATQFEVSATPGGSAITAGSAGTGSQSVFLVQKPAPSGRALQRLGIALASDTIQVMPSVDVGTIQ